MKNVTSTMRRAAGYTIDQTILIVAVVAILMTIIVATMGYDLLKRAGGTKMSSHLKQIEDANGLFYARYGMWPDDALTASGGTSNEASNIRILQQNVFGATSASRFSDKHTNLIPGFEDDGVNILHGFGSGGDIGMARVDLDSTTVTNSITSGQYMVVYFDDVPLAEAEEADEAVDGRVGRDNGRVTIVNAGDNCSTSNVPGSNPSTVRVCYVANLVN